MADDVTLPGTGSVVATDDVGGRQFQAVKVDLGGNGASSPLVRGQDTAANGIPIAPPNDDTITLSVDITRPSNTTAYTANDAFADTTPTANGFELTAATRGLGKASLLTDVALIYSNPTPDLIGELWIFDSAVTAISDNAAFSLSDADAKKLVAIVPFTINKSAANNKATHIGNLSHLCSSVGTANLKFLVKVLTAFTPAASDILTVRAKFARMD